MATLDKEQAADGTHTGAPWELGAAPWPRTDTCSTLGINQSPLSMCALRGHPRSSATTRGSDTQRPAISQAACRLWAWSGPRAPPGWGSPASQQQPPPFLVPENRHKCHSGDKFEGPCTTTG